MRLIAIALLMLLPLASQALPAYWYKWQHKQTGNYVCRQTNPGPDWVRMWGPFRNAACRPD